MQRKIFCNLLVLQLTIVLFSISHLAWAKDNADVTITIDQLPFLNKIPIAVPVFKSMTGTPEEVKLTSSSSKILYDSLEYTGYFKILDRPLSVDE